MSQILYLIRHTSVAVPQGVCYGQADVPCTEDFLLEATVILERLPSRLTYISSPLTRCFELASFLSASEVETDDRLKELSFGRWELQSWVNIPRTESDPWCEDFVNVAPPGGESARLLVARCADFLEYLWLRHDGPFGIVTHGGCIGAMLVYLLSMPVKDLFSVICGTGGVIKITRTGGEVSVERVLEGKSKTCIS